jgi:hypothetical protein
MRNIFDYAIVVVFLLPVLGCGGDGTRIVFVEGTVTYNGVPIEDANLSFSPVASDGTQAFGRTDARGRYVIQTLHGAVGRGTTPGEYTITINKEVGIPTGTMGTQPDGTEYEVMRYESAIPRFYGSISTTPLRATVTAGGSNVFDFDLVDNP